MAAKDLDKVQFQGLFSKIYVGSATIDVASLADGVGATSTITVPGVAITDLVIGWSHSVSVAGITVTAWVSAADTVSLRFQNESGGTLDLASATTRVLVGRLSPDYFNI